MLERPFRQAMRSAPKITLRYADILAAHFAGKRTLRVHFGHTDENAFLIGLLYERSCVDPDIGADDERLPIVSVWWRHQAGHDMSASGTIVEIGRLSSLYDAFTSCFMIEDHLYTQAYRDLLKALDADSPLIIEDHGNLDYYFPVASGDSIMAVCFDLELLQRTGARLPKHS
ncbi:MAG: hypothetical protein RDU25_04695 [Patescibacteria group bacterium]|nr:hypothetical protein [Patescibacteria group bacterium]